MSKERARRRAEREAAVAVASERRRAEVERRARAAARRTTWFGWLPARRSRPGGVLAERRRQQLTATLVLLIGANLLAFAFSPDWSLRALVLVASLLGAPVVHTMLTRRT